MALALYIFPVAVATACNTANVAHPFSLSMKIKIMERERYIKITNQRTTIHGGVTMVILNFLTRELSCKIDAKTSDDTCYIISHSLTEVDIPT